MLKNKSTIVFVATFVVVLFVANSTTHADIWDGYFAAEAGIYKELNAVSVGYLFGRQSDGSNATSSSGDYDGFPIFGGTVSVVHRIPGSPGPMIVTTFNDVVDPNDGELSLREAILLSNSNGECDLILLGAGQYQMSIQQQLSRSDFDIADDGGNSLTIRGIGSEETTIFANFIDRIFDCQPGAQVTLIGMKLTAGSTADFSESDFRGGAIRSRHTNLTIDDVHFDGNQTGNAGSGGAIYITGGTYSINNSLFTNNQTRHAGGAIFARSAIGTICLCEVKGNTTIENDFYSFQDGGAIGIREGRLDISRTKVDGNSDTGLNAFWSTINMDHVRFKQNVDGFAAHWANVNVHDSRFALNQGCGISLENNHSNLIVTESLFKRNGGDGIYMEGTDVSVMYSQFIENYYGLYFVSGDAQIIDCIFEDQSREGIIGMPSFGGKLLVRGTSVSGSIGSSGISYSGDEATLVNSRFNNNYSTGVELEVQRADIVNVSLADNWSSEGLSYCYDIDGNGAGLVFRSHTAASQLNIVNSQFVHNIAEFFSDSHAGEATTPPAPPCKSGKGGAIFISGYQPTSVSITSSLFAKNKSDDYGSIIAVDEEATAEINISNSILWNNFQSIGDIIDGPGIDAINVHHSLISDSDLNDGQARYGGAANHNSDANPKFVDWFNNNMRLGALSPAIDAGDGSELTADVFDVDSDGDIDEPTPDLDLLQRVVGAAVDIGPYEFH